MALNRKSFQTRAITAIIFAGVMLAGLLWNKWTFLILFSIIHFGCWFEFFGLVEKIYKTRFHIYVKLGLITIGYGLMLSFCGPLFRINGFGIRENICLPLSAAGFAVLLIGIFQKTAINVKAFFASLAGLVYISMSWGMMIDLFDLPELHINDTDYIIAVGFIPVVIIASIWINDTMAYIVGSFIGKTPLSSISPKKTWEGTIGGVILAILVSSLLVLFVFKFSKPTAGYHWVIIPAIASVAGTFGDLLESKLKRMAGVKDSGTFMPGHGGFMDRFDSLLLAIPFVWIYLKIFL